MLFRSSNIVDRMPHMDVWYSILILGYLIVLYVHLHFLEWELEKNDNCESRDSSVSIATRLRAGRSGAGNFSLHHRVRNDSGAHPASYLMGIRVSFPGGKAAGAWSWPLISIWCRDQRMCGAIIHSPNTPSWRGSQLKKHGLCWNEKLSNFMCYCYYSIMYRSPRYDTAAIFLTCLRQFVCVFTYFFLWGRSINCVGHNIPGRVLGFEREILTEGSTTRWTTWFIYIFIN
jgi:hypothetical protein